MYRIQYHSDIDTITLLFRAFPLDPATRSRGASCRNARLHISVTPVLLLSFEATFQVSKFRSSLESKFQNTLVFPIYTEKTLWDCDRFTQRKIRVPKQTKEKLTSGTSDPVSRSRQAFQSFPSHFPVIPSHFPVISQSFPVIFTESSVIPSHFQSFLPKFPHNPRQIPHNPTHSHTNPTQIPHKHSQSFPQIPHNSTRPHTNPTQISHKPHTSIPSHFPVIPSHFCRNSHTIPDKSHTIPHIPTQIPHKSHTSIPSHSQQSHTNPRQIPHKSHTNPTQTFPVTFANFGYNF